MRLSVETFKDIRVSLPNITGPAYLGYPSELHPMKQFNPSIIDAPDGLCHKCRYVASIRVDPLHQCSKQSPLFTYMKRSHANAWFKGTAIALLDEHFDTISWSWFLNAPHNQIHTFNSHSRWAVNMGSKNDYNPPWSKGHYDLRLFKIKDDVFATYNCKACKFSVSQINFEVKEDDDRNVVSLQIWSRKRHVFFDNWVQGRNQALFSIGSHLFVQYWYGRSADFGFVNFAHMRLLCGKRTVRNSNICGLIHDRTWTVKRISSISTHPQRLPVDEVALRDAKYFETASVCILSFDRFGRVTFLGIAHTHAKSDDRFMFGSKYQYYFYSVSKLFPYKIVSRSEPFFINDKDTLTYVTSLLIHGDYVMIAVGINDCDAKILRIPTDYVKSMLLKI